ncbi:hypothetical protein HIM_09933 [Hirsutella minnesotensis 3608]|uniref:Uncharacterized protein n=1 Tax=Hirsutella minnesotensis 3608 TaxID=1043627 RepID=A0A0F7ZKN1_9HYPO|nr:hypothetical protein HIM_09933 [Hirsutella minnesotensis 3608]
MAATMTKNTTSLVIKIKCENSFAYIVVVKDGKGVWIDSKDIGSFDYEYKIESMSMTSLASIVSATTPRSFADMLVTAFPVGATMSYMSAFEVLYVCAKMNMLENEITSTTAKKYVYMGLMKEAATLKSGSMTINMLQKPPEPVRHVEEAELDEVRAEVKEGSKIETKGDFINTWLAAPVEKNDKKKKGKKKKQSILSEPPVVEEPKVSNIEPHEVECISVDEKEPVALEEWGFTNRTAVDGWKY